MAQMRGAGADTLELRSVTPLAGAVSIRAMRIPGSTHGQRPLVSLVGLALQALAPVLFPWIRVSRLHLPAPLRSTSITRLHCYYECSDSCAAGAPIPLPALHRAGPLASCDRPSEPSDSNHLSAPMVALPPICQRRGPPLARSGLHLSLAGSPDEPAEASSLYFG